MLHALNKPYYFIPGLGAVNVDEDNFIKLTAIFAGANQYPHPSHLIGGVFVDLYYPKAPDEMKWLITKLLVTAYGGKEFSDIEWSSNFFAWLKPQTDSLYETIKVFTNE